MQHAANMPRPTHTQALDYALGLERQWGIAHSVIEGSARDADHDGLPLVKVTTHRLDGGRGEWDVWIEPDGTIYGEC